MPGTLVPGESDVKHREAQCPRPGFARKASSLQQRQTLQSVWNSTLLNIERLVKTSLWHGRPYVHWADSLTERLHGLFHERHVEFCERIRPCVTTMMHERAFVYCLIAKTYIMLVVSTNKFLVYNTIQSLICSIWVITANTAVLVHDMWKRKVRTYHTLDIYPLKNRSISQTVCIYRLKNRSTS